MIFNALRLLKYGIGILSSTIPTDGNTAPVMLLLSASFPLNGKKVCNNSYAARVAPNCGELLKILAGPPLKNALKPSSFQTVVAQWIKPL